MLVGLEIRDVVLIDRLEVAFAPGLTALTGETGAGKSILLDALGLALGARGDRGLVRTGCARAEVTAVFVLPASHPVREPLERQGIAFGEELLLRRQVTADGRSRAWVNDTPVSGGFLRELAERLVAVHGQQASRALLQPAVHRELLDRFAGADRERAALAAAFAAWRRAEAEHRQAEARAADWRAEREEVRARIDELARLKPLPGEEEELARERQRLMHRERLAGLVRESLELLEAGVDRLAAAERRLERALALAGEGFAEVREAVERARIEAEEARAGLEERARRLSAPERGLEEVEERLFALREAARRHRCPVEELPRLLEADRERLAELERRLAEIAQSGAEAQMRWSRVKEAARALSERRRQAARALEREVGAELAPLRLPHARLEVVLEPLAEQAWGAEGAERVRFAACTNPGQPPGPLDRIASGGELARFMLALEVVLARVHPVPTLIFDEVDAGIGGATADAVGERLSRLARERQVLVVTHAPQIAARADHHLRVVKRESGSGVRVEVRPLAPEERREELARMLAGARITEAARAAADSLLAAAGGRI